MFLNLILNLEKVGYVSQQYCKKIQFFGYYGSSKCSNTYLYVLLHICCISLYLCLIWYCSNFSPKIYVLNVDLRYSPNFWAITIFRSIEIINAMQVVGHTVGHTQVDCIGLGHTTSHLCGQHDSWKCKQNYIWIWIFMIKCTLKSI